MDSITYKKFTNTLKNNIVMVRAPISGKQRCVTLYRYIYSRQRIIKGCTVES